VCIFLLYFFVRTRADSGFTALEYIERWEGENIVQIRKEDIPKLRKKIAVYRWLSAPFNEAPGWEYHLNSDS